MVCLGDFNIISSLHDKRGGRPFCGSHSSGLSRFVEVHGAVYLGFSGPRFTWNNGRPRRVHILESLDRGVYSVEWRLAFPNATISQLPISQSNHLALLLAIWGLASPI